MKIKQFAAWLMYFVECYIEKDGSIRETQLLMEVLKSYCGSLSQNGTEFDISVEIGKYIDILRDKLRHQRGNAMDVLQKTKILGREERFDGVDLTFVEDILSGSIRGYDRFVYTIGKEKLGNLETLLYITFE